MNSSAHSTHLPLFAVHRLRIRWDSRLLALLGRLFCHERQGVVLCASPGAAVLFRSS